ncbi:PAS domain-containing protein [Pseudomonas sp. NPDC089758]|uniref:hybrid sensor histidine kinase/response regulator n=1 Tax=Pseudomonas sp. NPDC089758 TaxID=3364473 RepID=UPI003806AC13
MPVNEMLALREEIATLRQRITQLEAELQQHSPLGLDVYRFLFNTMDEGFCIIEFIDGPHGPLSDFVHVLVNPAYTKHAGIADATGQKMRDILPDEADAWVARYGPVLHTGAPQQFEQELRASGRVLSVSSFRIEPPERRQVAVLFKDVTERCNTEQALAQLNAHLEQRASEAMAQRSLFAELIDQSAANVHVLDNGMHWLAVNRKAREDFRFLYGHTPVVGAYMPSLMGDNAADRETILPLWRRALQGEQFTEIGAFGQQPEQRHYELRFNALRDAAGAPVGAYLFAYDISDRVQAQQRLANAEQALRQAQKMEAVGQLSGGIAHDFNNLLGSILNTQELIQLRLQQQRYTELDNLLDMSNSTAKRASSLVQRLLAFSRQQTLQPRATEVAELLGGMQELVRRTIGPSISLHSRFAPELWPTFIDPPQLESALLNLCINARDALPDGGVISIHGDNVALHNDQARPLGLPSGDYVRLSVVDNGCGMTEEVIARAFDPFFSTKPIGKGSGLGLSMTYGFVRQSGGQSRVLSQPGMGTRVELYLPRHHQQPTAQPQAPKASALAQHRANGQRIVLVEDQLALRVVISEVLQEQGYRVSAFENGRGALAHLEHSERPDLLISDIGLPDGPNGRHVAEHYRRQHPDLKVLFITGYDNSAALGGGPLLQGAHVLGKPFELDVLAECVQQLLSGSD